MLTFIFQALFSKASQILHGALDRRVYLKDVTLVIPSSWRDVKCKIQIHPPRGTSTFGVNGNFSTLGLDSPSGSLYHLAMTTPITHLN